ncbi:sensor histidine kinase [Quatrionicoccus australiensis]|uniref:sensor histidine kinase n=1 Tax=Quatrionicoccus australiensis TaxID=138118 RepID=UPI001CFAA4AB|nr:HAMP domain-containing sensor histidine kinase [Quatrionicoccus australiensis]MCB4358195.1 HAMP domain-containing histidine kinase [Quatrionicoccus australiensis]
MKPALAWLASFRLRLLFRGAFLALALAVVAMAVTVLQEEKQRSYDNYQASLGKTKEQIVARLHHPAGQLALLNPRRDARAASAGQPVVLPYSAIDFDDQNKVQNAVEMAGCLVQYPQSGSLCVAIGNNPWAGGFIYAAGTFASGPLLAHRIGDEILDGAHRLRVTVNLRGQTYRWLAPFEPQAGNGKWEGQRGRFTGYVEQDGRDYTGAKPVREFRGWVWQDGHCLKNSQAGNDETCARKSFFSLRLPVDVLRDALFLRDKPIWPPPDLDQFKVRVEVLAPGEEGTLFDSSRPGAVPPFSLDSLGGLLLSGESLSIRRADARDTEIIQLAGRDEALEQSSPLLTRLIRRLPVESLEAPVVELADEVTTPLGNYRILLKGDARSVNKVLSAVATRVSWFVGAMLGAIGLAWLVIEIGIIRRIAQLTRRTRGLSKSVHADGGLDAYDLADLRGHDELGILATGLNDLLRRVKEDVEREKIRAAQEKDMWHAVGHEIMSPLQSLLALHGSADDPSQRYISRMQQAVRVLYGSASPSEAFESSRLNVAAIDLAGFAANVAANAGIAEVRYVGSSEVLLVRADEFPLEDVFAHVLKNADRHRISGTPIVIDLTSSDSTATVSIFNSGPAIPDELLERIFEYGVSEQPTSGNRGQGLFVARTYMAKMGGTITANNIDDGVRFELALPRLIG